MKYRYVFQGVMAILCMSLVSACAGETSTPLIPVQQPTSVSAPALPPAGQPLQPTELPPTDVPAASGATPAGTVDPLLTPDGTVTLTVTSTRAPAADLPFLMRIDRISNIVGRGTLLEGQVAHGTLTSNTGVQILGPQGQAVSASILALLISNVVREQVTVGDYAGILMEGLDPAQLSPGMLITEVDAYESYEEALQELQ